MLSLFSLIKRLFPRGAGTAEEDADEKDQAAAQHQVVFYF